MDYKVLTTEQQVNMLKERIVGFEADHFGHQMNLDGLSAQPTTTKNKKEKEAAEKFAKESQAAIEAAHTVAVEELEKLEADMEKESEQESDKSEEDSE
jgi:CO dehydrogenase/acetyl-CoA synthase gamma subunit (corrinoid Fe-S protein)